MKKILYILLFLFTTINSFSQTNADTLIYLPKSYGNELSIVGGYSQMQNGWFNAGICYNINLTGYTKQLHSLSLDYNPFINNGGLSYQYEYLLLIFSVGGIGQYHTNFNENNLIIRPTVGINLYWFGIYYNYGFGLLKDLSNDNNKHNLFIKFSIPIKIY